MSFLHYRDATSTKQANQRLLATGVFLGLALATKWTGVAPLGAIGIWWWSLHKEIPPTTWLTKLAAFLVIPFSIYAASFLLDVRDPGVGFWSYLIHWQIQAWNFHEHLVASHPYESRWWSWLYLARPVWYYFKDDNGQIRGIIALGNPLLWWASIPALLAGAWFAIRHHYLPLTIALLGFLAAYVPWTIIHRTEFQYYLVGGVPFMFMVLAWWIDQILATKYRLLAWYFVIIAVLTFLFFLPLYTATPIPNWFYKLHLWFASWV